MTSTTIRPIPTHTVAARAEGVTRSYGEDSAIVLALDNVDVEIQEGQFTAIMGPSGSGKSTLLHVSPASTDRPSGRIFIGDTEITGMRTRH